MTSEDAALIERQEFPRADIVRIYGLPAGLALEPQNLTDELIDQAIDGFWREWCARYMPEYKFPEKP